MGVCSQLSEWADKHVQMLMILDLCVLFVDAVFLVIIITDFWGTVVDEGFDPCSILFWIPCDDTLQTDFLLTMISNLQFVQIWTVALLILFTAAMASGRWQAGEEERKLARGITVFSVGVISLARESLTVAREGFSVSDFESIINILSFLPAIYFLLSPALFLLTWFMEESRKSKLPRWYAIILVPVFGCGYSAVALGIGFIYSALLLWSLLAGSVVVVALGKHKQCWENLKRDFTPKDAEEEAVAQNPEDV